LSPHSSPPDARAAALKWGGPALAALGLIAVAALTLLPALRESPLTRWILTETLAPARVLPLIGLGAAFGLIGVRVFIASLLLFAFGIAGGLFAEDRLLWVLDTVPRAATHLFLTGPISYLAAGAALVSSARLRSYVVPAAAAIFGAMLGLTIRLTDPSLHDPAFTWTQVLTAFWIVAAVSLPLRAFWRGWFPIFGRILGSWLLAIGLLYGGASLVPQRRLPAPPTAGTPESQELTRLPDNDRRVPGLDRFQDQPGPGVPPDDLRQ
jgi:hypothetical protein